MDDVASAVGVNKATVYYHYASKSLILYDIYHRAAEATKSAVQPAKTESAREALRQCTVNLLRVVAADPHGAAVYFQESPYLGERFTSDQLDEIRQAELLVHSRISDIIDRGVTTGEFRDCDSHAFALGYIGMTLGSHRWLAPDSEEAADHIATEINRAMLRGLSRCIGSTSTQNKSAV
jgi:AcrR family transcriptional regulator